MGYEVISTKAHRYAGAQRSVGDKYTIQHRSELTLYRALGWVDEAPPAAPPAPAPPRGGYLPADKVAEPAAVAAEADGETRPKRAYRRRDLTVE